MSTPMTYESMTADERAWMCNGCGPKLNVLPDLVPDFIFHSACETHDFDYWLGKNASDRYNADRRFLTAMKAFAAKERSWFSRQWYTFLAYRYYAGVRAFGTKAFSFRDHYATQEDLVREMALDP